MATHLVGMEEQERSSRLLTQRTHTLTNTRKSYAGLSRERYSATDPDTLLS